MLYEYCEDSLTESLTEGTPEDAPDNLRNVRALRMFKQLMENLSNG